MALAPLARLGAGPLEHVSTDDLLAELIERFGTAMFCGFRDVPIIHQGVRHSGYITWMTKGEMREVVEVVRCGLRQARRTDKEQ